MNEPWSASLLAAYGTGALTWSITNGTLPTGVTLNTATGLLSGTPTVPGFYNFTASVTDGSTPTAQTATLQVSLKVAQQYVISTLAGGSPLATPATGLTYPIGAISGVTIDSAGNVYFISNSCIFRLNTDGVITRIAGNSRPGYSGDGGLATDAQIAPSPYSMLAFDPAGNLLLADSNNSRIRKISSGIITTIVGTGTSGSSGDGGNAIGAQIALPVGLAFDSTGNLFILDRSWGNVRKVSTSGIISTVASSISAPLGLAADGSGNVYFSDGSRSGVFRVSSSGTVTRIAGGILGGFSGDGGPAIQAQLSGPAGLATDSAGNLLIADTGNGRIRSISPNGIISTIAGSAPTNSGGFTGDGGPASSAQFASPDSIALDANGNLFVADAGNYRLRKISANGIINTVAGNGDLTRTNDGGPATSAGFAIPNAVAVDTRGNVYIADPGSQSVRMVDSNGMIATVAGNGISGYTGDGGPATAATLARPSGVTVDRAGNLLIADTLNGVIRKVSADGSISTIAGTGYAPYSGDGGLATLAGLSYPTGITVDNSGNIFVSDTYYEERVRRISPTGIITTVAGNGNSGYDQSNTFATSTPLNNPIGVAVDQSGNLFIADQLNHRVRKVTPDGLIRTVAGTDSFSPDSGDGGPATKASVYPYGVATDPFNNLIIAGVGRVRKVNPGGIITTIAGTGVATGYSGDGGPAINAQTNPRAVAIDSSGKMFVADFHNAVRVLTPSIAPPLVVPAANPPDAVAGASYSAAITMTGGTSPFTWSVPSTALPPGLSLDPSTGILSGTATTTGVYDFTLTVTDSGTVATTGTPAQTVSQNFRMNVVTPLVIATTAIPTGTFKVIYTSTTLTATGGTPSYAWSIASGTLPTGISFNGTTALLSGYPTVAGNFSVTFRVTDLGTPQQSKTLALNIVIQGPPTITTTTLPPAIVGQVYPATTIAVTGGTPPYKFSLSSNQPSGLTIDPATGAITGVPVGIFDGLFISVTDSAVSPFTVAKSFSPPVYYPLVINTWSPLVPATSNRGYSLALQAGAGAGTSSYAWSAANLPAWLALTPAGTLSGTPPAAGSFDLGISVTDGIQTLTATLTLVVNAPTGQTWTQLTPSGGPPSARYDHAAVFDAATKQMIVFGGSDTSALVNDVWAWSAVGNSWTNITPAGTTPKPKAGMSAVYDAASSRMIIFGGADYTPPLNILDPGIPRRVNSVWVLSNANQVAGSPAWTGLNTSGPFPAPRYRASAGYDPATNRMLIFGGIGDYPATTGALVDVWVLTNANGTGGAPVWQQLAPAGTPPSLRAYGTATYDPATNTLVVFGGGDPTEELSEVWSLSNANGLGGTPTWKRQFTAGGLIAPRSNHAAILDTATHGLVVFGGGTANGSCYSDTWDLANASGLAGGTTWNPLAPIGTIPPPVLSPTSVYDSVTNSMIVFGGVHCVGNSRPLTNDLWVLSNVIRPAITSFSPASITAGSPAFTLTVNGFDFIPASTIQWNGTALPTTFVSATQLTAVVPATNITLPAAASITVVNPTGPASLAATFPIIPADGSGSGTPTITALTPNSTPTGSPSLIVTINGTNFSSGQFAQWTANGVTTNLASQRTGTTTMTALIPAGLLASATTAQIAIANSSGALSNFANFTITTPDSRSQTIAFAPLPDAPLGAAPVTLSRDRQLRLAGELRVHNAVRVQYLRFSRLHRWRGTCVITATQSGNGSFNAATPVTQSFVVYTSGYTVTPLTLGGTSAANAINANGDVVGHSIAADNAYHAFLFTNGAMNDLGVFGSTNSATASGQGINANGQIVVDSGPVGLDAPAASVSSSSISAAAIPPEPFPITTPSPDLSGSSASLASPENETAFNQAAAINTLGQIAGTGEITTPNAPYFYARAFLNSSGATTDLGALSATDSSYASAINDSGQVVGMDLNTTNKSATAFLYSNGTLNALGDLGGGRSYATGINATGQIAGYSKTGAGPSICSFTAAAKCST